MPTIFVYFPLSNGGYLMLEQTTVVGSRGFGELFWVGKDFKEVIWSVIDVMDDASIDLNSSVSLIIFSSKSWLLGFISFLLASIAAYTMMNFSSELLSIL